MKTNQQIILAASMASFLTFTVMAQVNTDPKSDRTGVAGDRSTQPRTAPINDRAGGTLDDRANQLKTAPINDRAGGTLDDRANQLKKTAPISDRTGDARDDRANQLKTAPINDRTGDARDDRANQLKTAPVSDDRARNVRDRGDSTLKPIVQGTSQADTDRTAQVRQGILGGKDLSATAKNVKVITNNGRVTLRGPVSSEEEKRRIGEIATRIASSGNVDNQLEVTLKDNGK